MKNLKILLSISLISLTGFSMLMGVNKGVNLVKSTAEGTGPIYEKSPTTTIDLNKNEESEIRAYYSSLTTLSSEELNGKNLLKNLKPILQDMSYFSYEDAWELYEITDREWELSPASETTYGKYNSTENVIYDYEYGSNSSPKNDPYVKAMYRNRDENGVTVSSGRITNWQDHTSQNCTNREHIWPNSRGFAGSLNGENGPAFTDLHHLRCSDGPINKHLHIDLPYGYVGKNSITKNGVEYGSYLSGNIVGYPLNSSLEDDANAKVFEPQDEDKGDIARAVFYMVACYNNLSGNDVIDDYNPNLDLVDYVYVPDSAISSTSTTPVAIGKLSDLIKWHKKDPVDEFEIYRNDLIYNNYQHNRNPFIDFPQWVDIIWGDTTKSANPISDGINGKSDGDDATLSHIEIRGSYSETIPYQSTFDTSGIEVYAVYTNDTELKLSKSEYEIVSTINSSVLGTQIFKVSYANCTDFIQILVTNNGSSSGNVYSVSTDTLKSINGKKGSEAFSENNLNWNFSYTTNVATPYRSGSQFGSANNPYTSMTFSTSEIQNKIYSVSLDTKGPNNTNGTVEVLVGGTSYGTIKLTNVQTVYTFEGSSAGELEIIYRQGKDNTYAFYVYGITVNCYAFSEKEQANAYSTYFLNITGPICEQQNGAFESVWTSLKNEFNYMDADSINYVKDVYKGVSSDLNVASMLERYEEIIRKYDFDEFMDLNISSSRRISNPIMVNNNYIIVIAIAFTLVGVGAFAVKLKKKD